MPEVGLAERFNTAGAWACLCGIQPCNWRAISTDTGIFIVWSFYSCTRQEFYGRIFLQTLQIPPYSNKVLLSGLMANYRRKSKCDCSSGNFSGKKWLRIHLNVHTGIQQISIKEDKGQQEESHSEFINHSHLLLWHENLPLPFTILTSCGLTQADEIFSFIDGLGDWGSILDRNPDCQTTKLCDQASDMLVQPAGNDC